MSASFVQDSWLYNCLLDIVVLRLTLLLPNCVECYICVAEDVYYDLSSVIIISV